MRDITAAFLQHVAESASHNKELQNQIRDRILPRKTTKSQFIKDAEALKGKIITMADQLTQSVSEYLNPYEHFGNRKSQWSERNRESFEDDMRLSIRESHEDLKKLAITQTLRAKEDASQNKDQAQHYKEIISSLEDMLRLYSGQFIEMQQERMKSQQQKTPRSTARRVLSETASEEEVKQNVVQVEYEDAQMKELLDLESEVLISEMETETVRDIERKVMEISSLNQLFSTKVLEQAETIQAIHTQSVDTNENIRLGNKKLEQASKRTFNSREFIVFYLIVLSFALLFLDYYG
eukprot:TRINITY_DN3970_c0_g1_i1.p1 TRINITY_DN3970_c0_g1~~TRINITY_DN3970_c0_g1_i1.p1  ORF type:complete len:294 (+),score=73.78 TRINITY_DN3970_c0_g1_i1:63-944(+)